jgi:hypothetical protein
MKTFTNSIFFLTFLCFLSCNSKPVTEEIEREEPIVIEQETPEVFVPDTVKKKHQIKEEKENLAKIEKKYGEQWGFCECVVANDSIDKAVKNLIDFETPQAEKLLDRFDYVSKKCQAFLGMDASKTPEERQKHEKKVKKCLKDANIKN